MFAVLKNEIGNKYGLLTVVSRAKNVKGRVHWNCQCDCGNYKESISAYSLRSGLSISCGCQHNGHKSSDLVSLIVHAKRRKYYQEVKKLIKET